MSIFTHIPFLTRKKNAPVQVISTRWEDRTKILDENVNLFCWKRTENKNISEYLKYLIQSDPTPISFTTSINELEKNLQKARSAWNLDQGTNSVFFWNDVHRLINDFLMFSDRLSGSVQIRLVNNDACRKFHIDGYNLRLFTTYNGNGTEWLPEEATNRKAFGTTNERIVKDDSKVQRMDPFEVGILKGEVPGGNNGNKGIVHRSPEIEKEGKKRIILRVDI
jgi:hypothetical protein